MSALYRAIRAKAKLSIRQAGKALGVSQRTAYRWETQAPRVAELAMEHVSDAKRRAEEKRGNI